jgi:uncharacterized repeat protein (TIGR02543 family)
VVDYIFNSAAKIVPEDGKPMGINVTVVGAGSVAKTPAQPPYQCGDTVALSAAAETGWSFAGWSGDVTGTEPVVNVTITGPMEATAIFTQNQYHLNVNIQNDGDGGAGNTVTRTPQQNTYVYGDEVALEAKPASGWYFIGWSGSGVAGSQNPLTVTMLGDMTIIAAFSTNPPPIFESIAHQTAVIGQSLTFQVEANDPLGEPVTLTYDTLPPGATFVDNGDGTGGFNWWPNVWQAGEHYVTFFASDGQTQSSMIVNVTVAGMGLALPMIIGSGQ